MDSIVASGAFINEVNIGNLKFPLLIRSNTEIADVRVYNQ